MCVLVILNLETGVAYSRNSPPSPRGRPSSSLLDRVLSELAGVLTLCINPSLFLRLQLLCSTLYPLTLPALLAVLGLASALVTLVVVSTPLLVRAFYAPSLSKLSLSIRSFNGWVPFSFLIWKSDPNLG